MKYKVLLNTNRWFYIDVPFTSKEEIIDYVNWEVNDFGEFATDTVEKCEEIYHEKDFFNEDEEEYDDEEWEEFEPGRVHVDIFSLNP